MQSSSLVRGKGNIDLKNNLTAIVPGDAGVRVNKDNSISLAKIAHGKQLFDDYSQDINTLDDNFQYGGSQSIGNTTNNFNTQSSAKKSRIELHQVTAKFGSCSRKVGFA